MIASLRGTLLALGLDYAVVETAGVGFLVYVPGPVRGSLGSPGESVFLHTLLIVREDSLTLYGFATVEQRTTFEKVLTVSGIGPRIALQVVSAFTYDELRLTIAQNDTTRLARVPGIGKKTAERLVLELKSRLDLKNLPVAPTGSGSEPSTSTVSAAVFALNQDLLDLLVSLGYSSAEASAAIGALPADAPNALEERLRLALRYFGSA
ncbi:MAG: Holliday junction branch migration protein RuvA [Chloroflexaceae bacterium]|nr:Holliday junction branch migration protein RuvA [Chloroflexaceae bacterium]